MTVPGPKSKIPSIKGPRWGHADLRAHRQRTQDRREGGWLRSNDKICQLIVSERTGKPIDPKTLREVFRVELERGVAVADSEVANALYNNAVHSNNVAAPDLEEQSAHALV